MTHRLLLCALVLTLTACGAVPDSRVGTTILYKEATCTTKDRTVAYIVAPQGPADAQIFAYIHHIGETQGYSDMATNNKGLWTGKTRNGERYECRYQ